MRKLMIENESDKLCNIVERTEMRMDHQFRMHDCALNAHE